MLSTIVYLKERCTALAPTSKLKPILAFCLLALCAPSSTEAAVITYDLTGAIGIGAFDHFKLDKDTGVGRDAQVIFDDGGTANTFTDDSWLMQGLLVGRGGLWEVDFDFGPVSNVVHGLVVFGEAGSRTLGTLTPLFDYSGSVDVAAGTALEVITRGGPLTINFRGQGFDALGRVKDWWTVHAGGRGFHGDPGFHIRPAPPSEIPEPATCGLLLSGLLGAGALRRKKQSNK